MSTIRVDAETLRGKATEIRNMKSTHDDNIARVGALIRGLSGEFTGQAATAYIEKFESMQATLTSFSEMIESFARDLDAVAANFTEVDTSLAGSLSK